jgi:hypothetical protein
LRKKLVLFTYFETKTDLFNHLYLELKAEMASASSFAGTARKLEVYADGAGPAVVVLPAAPKLTAFRCSTTPNLLAEALPVVWDQYATLFRL